MRSMTAVTEMRGDSHRSAPGRWAEAKGGDSMDTGDEGAGIQERVRKEVRSELDPEQ